MTMPIDALRELHATATDESALPLARYRAARALLANLRGAAADVLAAIRDLLGLTADDDDFAISDAVWQLADAAKVEDIIEKADGGGAPAPTEPAAVEAQRPTLTDAHRSGLHGLAQRGAFGPHVAARAVEGMEGEALDAFAQALLDNGRVILGKPDAMPDDVVTELQAVEEQLAAVLAEGTEEGEEGEEEVAAAAQEGAVAASAVLRRQRNTARTERDEARVERKALKAKVERFELRDYLTDKLRAIGKGVDSETFGRWIEIGLKSGRPMIDELVANRNAPPSAMPLDDVETPRPTDIHTVQEAWDACEDDAIRELEEVEAKRAKRERREPIPLQPHHIVARSQDIAFVRYPSLFGEQPAAT